MKYPAKLKPGATIGLVSPSSAISPEREKACIERLKNKIGYTDVVFNMMPELFSLGDLQQVYEVILNKKLLAPAFRRIIADKVEKTEHVQGGEGHRPSALFRYKKN